MVGRRLLDENGMEEKHCFGGFALFRQHGSGPSHRQDPPSPPLPSSPLPDLPSLTPSRPSHASSWFPWQEVALRIPSAACGCSHFMWPLSTLLEGMQVNIAHGIWTSLSLSHSLTRIFIYWPLTGRAECIRMARAPP